jgi:hypothetical protein
MNRNTFNRAEHKENGITNIDSIRKPCDRITRVPKIAGTLQPKPISDITNDRPSNPNLSIKASIKNAALDRYPLSSTIAIQRKNRKITGRNAATVAIPAYSPSIRNPFKKAGNDENNGSKAILLNQFNPFPSNCCNGDPIA